MITEFKIFESYENSIEFSVGDIVVWSKMNDEYQSYCPYIDQDGKMVDGIYGKEYEILEIFFSGYKYNQIRKSDLNNFYIKVKNIESGEVMNTTSPNNFTLKSKFTFPDGPHIGDYVQCDIGISIFEFLNTRIGRFVKYDFNDELKYIIEWRNIPIDKRYLFWNVTNPYIKDLGYLNVKLDNIVYYHKDIKNIEKNIKRNIKVKKYNI